MTIENISMERVENGFIIRVHGFTINNGEKEFDSQEFVFAERTDAVAKLTELINTI